MSNPVHLVRRAIVAVHGAEAPGFLNSILTVSTLSLAEGELRYGALLTPQGKVLADMLLTRAGETILMDVAVEAAAVVVKRLTLMKLRAPVVIAERPDLASIAFVGVADPRSALAPARSIGSPPPNQNAGDYDRARIAAGLPEQGADFEAEDVFPHDINMDLLGGVDFRKGCFVGQEVASRMQRRGTVRRRTLKAMTTAAVPAPVLAGDFEIGQLTSAIDGVALARVRLDRLAEAQRDGVRVTAAGVDVQFEAPNWLNAETLPGGSQP